jgi:preprotein translocase subunit SecG
VRPPFLAQIAGGAGGGDIFPGGAAALCARDDVIEGELVRATAILAGEALAPQDFDRLAD